MYIIAVCCFRCVLYVSDEAQRVCTVESTSISVRPLSGLLYIFWILEMYVAYITAVQTTSKQYYISYFTRLHIGRNTTQ